MDHWNYRIVKEKYEVFDMVLADPYEFYQIYEVYYNEDGSISSWCGEPVAAFGETLEELVKDHALIAEAFKRPILDMDDLISATKIS